MTFGTTSLGSTAFGSSAQSTPSVAAVVTPNLIIKGNKVTWLIFSAVKLLQPKLPFN